MNPQNQMQQTQPQVAMPGQPMQPVQAQPFVQTQPTQANAMNIGAAAISAKAASPVSPNAEVPFSTQSTLLISEIRDNVVIMKDGSFRAVVACKSINFDLMSDTEREGVEYSYQNFLNSLKFTTRYIR